VIARLAKPFALTTVVVAFACCAAPQPAAAISPAKAICGLAGLFSGVAGKICSAASHGKTVLDAGKKLLGGHVGGAVKTVLGGGGTATKTVTTAAALAGVAAWVYGGARFALHETAAVISSTTRPELGSTWFSSFYWRMAGVGGLLTLPFLFAAAIQALFRSDLGLLLRAAFGYLPLGVLAVFIAAPVTTLLLTASDQISSFVASAAGNADSTFLAKITTIAGGVSLLAHSPFLAFFVGLLAAAATLVLWCELLIRAAAVYVIVLMLPLFFAALVWPARRVWAVRAVEMLVALILSKFAIVAVLALGGAAIGHTAVPSITQMLAGATLVLLAAFSPWALLRLLPLHELAAGAAGGLRSRAQEPLALAPAEDASDAARDTAARLLAQPEPDVAPVPQNALDRLGDPPPPQPNDGAGEAAGEDSGTGGSAAKPGAPASPDAGDPAAASAPQSGDTSAGTTPPPPEVEPPGAAPDPAGEPGPEERIPGMPPMWQAGDNTWRTLHLEPEADWRPLNEPDPPPPDDVDRPPTDDDPLPPPQERDDGRW
jgi:hypothetical protein